MVMVLSHWSKIESFLLCFDMDGQKKNKANYGKAPTPPSLSHSVLHFFLLLLCFQQNHDYDEPSVLFLEDLSCCTPRLKQIDLFIKTKFLVMALLILYCTHIWVQFKLKIFWSTWLEKRHFRVKVLHGFAQKIVKKNKRH